ncbi:hypothetical protein ACLB0R_05210 [Sphingomonas sp. GlSt437]|uniref:hypothetical protein n=1 Tax=Sphingomonas sp. GlSt437 TaxID=3389970 RepID=UPI003A8B3497
MIDRRSKMIRKLSSGEAPQRYWGDGINEIGDLMFRLLADSPATAEGTFVVLSPRRVTVERIVRDFAGTLEFDGIVIS